jgi:NAD-dependent SIR2 family protein deacetylase
LGLLVIAVFGVLIALDRLSYKVGVPIEQPVPYSHQLHVGGLQMQCQYCHTYVEQGASASIPPIETCMSCHSQIAVDRPTLQPIRDSYANNIPVQWNKVYNVPGFVYFNHSIHVAKGVGCSTCHGNVANQAVVAKEQAMYMSWCLDCHRAPEKYVRPQSEIYNMTWTPPANQLEIGTQLVQEYNIQKQQLANCGICHR